MHRRTWFRVAVVVGVLVLIAGAGVAWWLSQDSEPETTPTAKTESVAPTKESPIVAPTPPTTPTPPVPEDRSKPSAQELRDIDDLLTQDKPEEAAARLQALRAAYPEDAHVRRREAGLEAQKPGGDATALKLYAEALALDPALARDLGFHAQLDTLLRKRPVTDAAIDLALALGPQGHGVLVDYINDPKGWATYAQRRRIRDALEKDGAAAEVDMPLNVRRDLWQVPQSPTPCQTMQSALTVMQATPPHVDNVDAIKAAVAPKPAANADEAEKAACVAVAPLLATVRTSYAQSFPKAFPKSKKRTHKKKKGR